MLLCQSGRFETKNMQPHSDPCVTLHSNRFLITTLISVSHLSRNGPNPENNLACAQEGPKVQNASNPKKSQHFLKMRSEPRCAAAWVGSGGQAAAHLCEHPIGLIARNNQNRVQKGSQSAAKPQIQKLQRA